jgi:Leucine-rich repeat (LRR) protein
LNDSLTALPASLVVSLTTRHQSCSNKFTLSAPTRLELEGLDCSDEFIPARHLQPLTQLRQLSLRDVDIDRNAEELQSLPALFRLQGMSRALSALIQLTALDLRSNSFSTSEPLATLQRLQSLDLSCCNLTAVPAQLSALTHSLFLTLLAPSTSIAAVSTWHH